MARAAAVSTLQRSVDAENTARTLEDRALRSTMTASLAPLQSKATRGSPENDARVSTLESRTTAMLATLSTQVGTSMFVNDIIGRSRPFFHGLLYAENNTPTCY